MAAMPPAKPWAAASQNLSRLNDTGAPVDTSSSLAARWARALCSVGHKVRNRLKLNLHGEWKKKEKQEKKEYNSQRAVEKKVEKKKKRRNKTKKTKGKKIQCS